LAVNNLDNDQIANAQTVSTHLISNVVHQVYTTWSFTTWCRIWFTYGAVAWLHHSTGRMAHGWRFRAGINMAVYSLNNEHWRSNMAYQLNTGSSADADKPAARRV